ncbi:Crp/Fnr family transcriptional regulator [Lutibaculum baratangense]|uniref:cAMP-binding protein n=1 Tax=Lutibaculum baratangense AMV1 TaxID=631454 RepID=V4RGJ6_9HYPH|nr:Crp/Fnr family transcriptional regulator [Lutibaculum baratangense]ESR25281.1 cAMP-binding protein [Lutibaculum baratangense AMV1]
MIRALPSTERVVAAGRDIVAQGTSPHVSTLVLDGFAIRYNLLAQGTRMISAIHVPGDFCDLHSFLLRKMDHSVAALTECHICQVPHEALAQIVERHPGLTRLLWTSTVVDAGIHRQWMVRMGRRAALANLAHFICELFVRLKLVGMTTGNGFMTPLNQAQMADATAMSAVHVNRTVQELRRRGLLGWEGRHITLPDWEGLVELAEFDPTYLNLTEEQVRAMSLG